MTGYAYRIYLGARYVALFYDLYIDLIDRRCVYTWSALMSRTLKIV